MVHSLNKICLRTMILVISSIVYVLKSIQTCTSWRWAIFTAPFTTEKKSHLTWCSYFLWNGHIFSALSFCPDEHRIFLKKPSLPSSPVFTCCAYINFMRCKACNCPCRPSDRVRWKIANYVIVSCQIRQEGGNLTSWSKKHRAKVFISSSFSKF